MSASFDYIPYEDIVWDKALGQGSFGAVYKGSYLGTDIAIKEVFPPKPETYDKEKRDKYFEREWRIMRECRHPNIVQFLGLAQDPAQLEKWLIISEYIPNGNLRQYMQKTHQNPFPWRLRISFATDIARALAYLHARKCVHRDLKGENLLVDAIQRIKVTDFGFARVTTSDDRKRLTLCGTEAYMSPEIMNSEDFDERTDVYSMGMIFVEIAARKVADSNNGVFARPAPTYMLDPKEVRERASPNCPPDFLQLALQCTALAPDSRPSMKEVLSRLRAIELEVAARTGPRAEHIGSIKIARKKDHVQLKQIGACFKPNELPPGVNHIKEEDQPESDEEEDEVSRMMMQGIQEGNKTVYRTAKWVEAEEYPRPKLLDIYNDPNVPSSKPAPSVHLPGHLAAPATISTTSTVKAHHHGAESAQTSSDVFTDQTGDSDVFTASPAVHHNAHGGPGGLASRAHRFSMPNKKYDGSRKQSALKTALGYMGGARPMGSNEERCAVCKGRVARRPHLKCDDCSMVAHYKCSAQAPHNCSA